jgi:hypothetical protein
MAGGIDNTANVEGDPVGVATAVDLTFESKFDLSQPSSQVLVQRQILDLFDVTSDSSKNVRVHRCSGAVADSMINGTALLRAPLRIGESSYIRSVQSSSTITFTLPYFPQREIRTARI